MTSLTFSTTNENGRTTAARGEGYFISARTHRYGRFVASSVYLENIVRELLVFMFANTNNTKYFGIEDNGRDAADGLLPADDH